MSRRINPSRTDAQRKRHREWAREYRKRKPMSEETRTKNRDRVAKWNKENPHVRKQHSWNSQSIPMTIETYERLAQEQEYRCALCGRHQDDMPHSLHVDHDHNSGIVRGLLCHMCNPALGFFNDDPKLLKKAIHYLTKKRPEAKL